jgi:putative transposase
VDGADDELVQVAPLLARIPDFAGLIAAPPDTAATARLERAATVGRPLGAPAWIAESARRLGRSLAPRKRGPKPRDERDDSSRRALPRLK